MLSPHLALERGEGVLDREGGAKGSVRVILVRDGRAEQRHHPVTQELVDRPLIVMDLGQGDLEDAIHDAVDLFGVQALRHRGES